jgi:hypothetical protein
VKREGYQGLAERRFGGPGLIKKEAAFAAASAGSTTPPSVVDGVWAW